MRAYRIEAEWAPREGAPLTEKELRTHDVMRADYAYRNPHGSLCEIDIPTPAEDEVLIRVGACGICGSDAHMLHTDEAGYMTYPGHVRFPVVIGHEYAGEIVEVGSGVRRLRKGELVSIEAMRGCGSCPACRMGMFNQCEDIVEPGFTIDGGFAEYSVMKERSCYSLDPLEARLGDRQRAMEAGALVEPACIAYNGMFVAGGGIHVGGAMAVFGAGPIGLAAIALGIAAGAAEVFVFDTIPLRRELAKKMGAGHVYDPIALAKQGLDAGDVIMQETRGVGVSTVIEATGNTKAVYSAIVKSIAIGAKIIQLGMDGRPAEVDLVPIQNLSAKIIGAMGQTGADMYPSVIRLMAAGRLDLFPMVTDRCPLDQIADGIAKFDRRETGKVLALP